MWQGIDYRHIKVGSPLTEALTDGDAQAFKGILAAHLAVVQKESFDEEAGLSPRTLYPMLAPSGNPRLANIARVVRAIAKSAA
jgi:DNA-binding phage protein